MTTIGTHTARRPWSRRRRITLGVVALLLVGVLVAVALTLLRAEIQGALEVPATDPSDVEFFGSVAQHTSTAECDANTAGGALVQNIVGGPGQFCEVSAAARLVNGEAANRAWVIQDVTYNPQVVAAFVNGECGKEIPLGSGGTSIRMKFTVGNDVTGGSTYPAGAEAGLIIVPEQEYVDGDCPRG